MNIKIHNCVCYILYTLFENDFIDFYIKLNKKFVNSVRDLIVTYIILVSGSFTSTMEFTLLYVCILPFHAGFMCQCFSIHPHSDCYR